MALKYLSVVMLAVLLCSGCKKNTVSPALSGQYRQVNTNNSSVSYVIIGSDMTLTELSANSKGIHDYNKYAYQIQSDAVLISSSLYIYKWSGDTLKLLNDIDDPASSSNMILVKDATTPSLDTWMPAAVYSTQLPWPDLEIDAMTMLGNTIWTSYQYNSEVRGYNVSTGQYTGTFSTTNNIGGVEAVGGYLWVYDETARTLLKLDPVNGNVVFTAAALPSGYGEPTQLAYDGVNSIFCLSSSRLDIYNTGTNSYNTYQMPDSYSDVAYNGGYIYALGHYSRIDKIDATTLQVVKTYRLDASKTHVGLTAAGGNDLWVYIWDGLTTPGYFQKITLN